MTWHGGWLPALVASLAVLVSACGRDANGTPTLVIDVEQEVTLVPDSLDLLQGTDAWIQIDAEETAVAQPGSFPVGVRFGPPCCLVSFDSIQVLVGAFAEEATHSFPIYVSSYDYYYHGDDSLTVRILPVDHFDIELPLCPSSGVLWVAVQDGEAGGWAEIPVSSDIASFRVFQDRVWIAAGAVNGGVSTLVVSLVATDDLVRVGERLGDPCEERAWVEGGFRVVNRAPVVSAGGGGTFVQPFIEMVRYPDEINFEADVTVVFEQVPDRLVRITATPWYQHNPFESPGVVYQSDTLRVALPDLSGVPGWDSGWGLDPAIPIDWRLQVGASEIHEGTLSP